MSKIKAFWFRLKVFMWYLFTEPFREVYGFLYYLSEMLNKTKSWIYVFLVISIVALVMNNRPAAGLFMIVLFTMILLWEWQSGNFMKRYRRVKKQEIKQKLEEKEERLMKEDGGDVNG